MQLELEDYRHSGIVDLCIDIRRLVGDVIQGVVCVPKPGQLRLGYYLSALKALLLVVSVSVRLRCHQVTRVVTRASLTVISTPSVDT